MTRRQIHPWFDLTLCIALAAAVGACDAEGDEDLELERDAVEDLDAADDEDLEVADGGGVAVLPTEDDVVRPADEGDDPPIKK